jgi:hypothetical protein
LILLFGSVFADELPGGIAWYDVNKKEDQRDDGPEHWNDYQQPPHQRERESPHMARIIAKRCTSAKLGIKV